MYRLYDVRTGQVEALVVALQLLAASGERAASVIFLCQPVSLDHRAHGAIQYQYPVFWYGNHLFSDLFKLQRYCIFLKNENHFLLASKSLIYNNILKLRAAKGEHAVSVMC